MTFWKREKANRENIRMEEELTKSYYKREFLGEIKQLSMVLGVIGT